MNKRQLFIYILKKVIIKEIDKHYCVVIPRESLSNHVDACLSCLLTGIERDYKALVSGEIGDAYSTVYSVRDK